MAAAFAAVVVARLRSLPGAVAVVPGDGRRHRRHPEVPAAQQLLHRRDHPEHPVRVHRWSSSSSTSVARRCRSTRIGRRAARWTRPSGPAARRRAGGPCRSRRRGASWELAPSAPPAARHRRAAPHLPRFRVLARARARWACATAITFLDVHRGDRRGRHAVALADHLRRRRARSPSASSPPSGTSRCCSP